MCNSLEPEYFGDCEVCEQDKLENQLKFLKGRWICLDCLKKEQKVDEKWLKKVCPKCGSCDLQYMSGWWIIDNPRATNFCYNCGLFFSKNDCRKT